MDYSEKLCCGESAVLINILPELSLTQQLDFATTLICYPTSRSSSKRLISVVFVNFLREDFGREFCLVKNTILHTLFLKIMKDLRTDFGASFEVSVSPQDDSSITRTCCKDFLSKRATRYI